MSKEPIDYPIFNACRPFDLTCPLPNDTRNTSREIYFTINGIHVSDKYVIYNTSDAVLEHPGLEAQPSGIERTWICCKQASTHEDLVCWSIIFACGLNTNHMHIIVLKSSSTEKC